jgi:hypothetical protein
VFIYMMLMLNFNIKCKRKYAMLTADKKQSPRVAPDNGEEYKSDSSTHYTVIDPLPRSRASSVDSQPQSRENSTVPSDQQTPLLRSPTSVAQNGSVPAPLTGDEPYIRLYQEVQVYHPITRLHTQLQLMMSEWYNHLFDKTDTTRWGPWARYIARYNSDTLEKMKEDFATIARSFTQIYRSENPADKTQAEFLLSQVNSICGKYNHDAIYNLLRMYAIHIQQNIKLNRTSKADALLSETNINANGLTKNCLILNERNADLTHQLAEAKGEIVSAQQVIANQQYSLQLMRQQNISLEERNKALQDKNASQKEIIEYHENRMQAEISRLQEDSERRTKEEAGRLQEQFRKLEEALMTKFAELGSSPPTTEDKPEDEQSSPKSTVTKPTLF